MAHKAAVRSFIQIASVNDTAQGTVIASPTYYLLPIQFAAFERGFSSEDIIEGDDINTGSPWLTGSDLNFGHPSIKFTVWPNATELHALFMWFMRTANAAAAGSSVASPVDGDLTASRTIVASNASEQFKASAVLNSMEIKFGRKGKLTVNCEAAVVPASKTVDVSAKVARQAGASMWRRHVSMSALFGGNASIYELTLKFSRPPAAVAPAFGGGASPSFKTLQFDENGLYQFDISGSVYAGEGFDPSATADIGGAVNLASGFTFDDRTKNFILQGGDYKISSYSDGENDGSRMNNFEGKVIFDGTRFFGISVLSAS